MDNLKDFIDVVFGGSITLDKVFTICVGIFAVVKTFTEWRATKKLINANRELTATEKSVSKLTEDNKKLRQACATLGDIVVTAYLSSNTISSDTKKELVTLSNQLKEQGELDLAKPVIKLVEKIEEGTNTDLGTIKQELKEKTENINEVLNIASETAQNAIDKLTV
jgi:uncharacterized protein YrzB (UPF0473 family)